MKAEVWQIKTGGAMIGGAIGTCILQPLDVLKTRLQLPQHNNGLHQV